MNKLFKLMDIYFLLCVLIALVRLCTKL